MSRFASGSILGFFLGAVVILALAGQSGEHSLTHFRLPLHLEFEVGETEATVAPQVAATSPVSYPATATVSDYSVPPEFKAIQEDRQRVGSALACSSLFQGVSPQQANAEFVCSLQVAACQEEENAACTAVSVKPSACATGPLAPSDVCDTLQTTAAKLYALAATYEEQTYYERADEVRALARNLRSQSLFIAQEVAISAVAETASLPDCPPVPDKTGSITVESTLAPASPVIEAPSDPANPDS